MNSEPPEFGGRHLGGVERENARIQYEREVDDYIFAAPDPIMRLVRVERVFEVENEACGEDYWIRLADALLIHTNPLRVIDKDSLGFSNKLLFEVHVLYGMCCLCGRRLVAKAHPIFQRTCLWCIENRNLNKELISRSKALEMGLTENALRNLPSVVDGSRRMYLETDVIERLRVIKENKESKEQRKAYKKDRRRKALIRLGYYRDTDPCPMSHKCHRVIYGQFLEEGKPGLRETVQRIEVAKTLQKIHRGLIEYPNLILEVARNLPYAEWETDKVAKWVRVIRERSDKKKAVFNIISVGVASYSAVQDIIALRAAIPNTPLETRLGARNIYNRMNRVMEANGLEKTTCEGHLVRIREQQAMYPWHHHLQPEVIVPELKRYIYQTAEERERIWSAFRKDLVGSIPEEKDYIQGKCFLSMDEMKVKIKCNRMDWIKDEVEGLVNESTWKKVERRFWSVRNTTWTKAMEYCLAS
jgi:hypothetical protein